MKYSYSKNLAGIGGLHQAGKWSVVRTVRDSVVREYREKKQVSFYLKNPALKGVFTFVIQEGDKVVSEWMMFSCF